MVFLRKATTSNSALLAVGIMASLFFYFFTNTSAADQVANPSSSNSNVNSPSAGSDANSNINANAALKKRQEEIQKKQEQLNSVQSQVNTFEKKSGILDQKTDTLQSMLAILDSEIKGAETSLQETEKGLAAIQQSLNDKDHEITLKEDNIDKRKKFLEEYMRKLDLLDKKSVVEIMLEKPSISDYFQEMESIVAFEQRLQELLAELNIAKSNLITEKSSIEEARNEQAALYAMQEEQKIELDKDKKDREDLLLETKNEQNQIQGLMDKGNEVISRLTAEITALQSCGTKIDFGQALEEAKIVAQLTGVRA